MEVLILVGGRGTRLATGKNAPPKVLHELGGRPILWHVMQLYRSRGHDEFILPLGYKGGEIIRYFSERPGHADVDFELRVSGDQPEIAYLMAPPKPYCIRFVETGIDTKKGERIRRAARHIKGDAFFATYGDGLADVDLDALLQFHRRHGRVATITVVRARSQFGHVSVGAKGIVTALIEKPLLPEWINGGFFVFNREIIEYLRPGGDLETDCFPRLVEAGQLAAFPHEGFWVCMDTDKDYLALDQMCQTGPPPWQTW